MGHMELLAKMMGYYSVPTFASNRRSGFIA